MAGISRLRPGQPSGSGGAVIRMAGVSRTARSRARTGTGNGGWSSSNNASMNYSCGCNVPASNN